jgi:hypothetical protein
MEAQISVSQVDSWRVEVFDRLFNPLSSDNAKLFGQTRSGGLYFFPGIPDVKLGSGLDIYVAMASGGNAHDCIFAVLRADTQPVSSYWVNSSRFEHASTG